MQCSQDILTKNALLVHLVTSNLVSVTKCLRQNVDFVFWRKLPNLLEGDADSQERDRLFEKFRKTKKLTNNSNIGSADKPKSRATKNSKI